MLFHLCETPPYHRLSAQVHYRWTDGDLCRGRERRLEPEALCGPRARAHRVVRRGGLAGVLEDAVGGLEETLDEAVLVPVKVSQQDGDYWALEWPRADKGGWVCMVAVLQGETERGSTGSKTEQIARRAAPLDRRSSLHG